jgi:hypothetical protein
MISVSVAPFFRWSIATTWAVLFLPNFWPCPVIWYYLRPSAGIPASFASLHIRWGTDFSFRVDRSACANTAGRFFDRPRKCWLAQLHA